MSDKAPGDGADDVKPVAKNARLLSPRSHNIDNKDSKSSNKHKQQKNKNLRYGI